MADIFYLTNIKFDFGAVQQLPRDRRLAGADAPAAGQRPGPGEGRPCRQRSASCCRRARPPSSTCPPTRPRRRWRRRWPSSSEHSCDGVIALGGGSPIDLAKGVALLATHAGALEDYAAIYGGVARIGPVAPLVAIPTTAGTGSEVGRAALITLRDGRKLGFISPHLIPKHRDLRSGADRRPAAGARRRDRARRAVALHRDLPVAAHQPAGRGDRARRRGPHLAQHRGGRRRRRHARRAGR